MVYNREEEVYYTDKPNKSLFFLYRTIPGRVILKVAISKPVSKLGGLYMNSPFSKYKIKRFIKKNKINMDDYPKIKYKSFNQFFVREIMAGKRPMKGKVSDLLSPADAKLTVYPINDETVLNVKNSKYTISEIIKDKKIANEFKNGLCLVFRLSVDDYHHYHFIDDGFVISTKKIKGVLHTVNPITYKSHKVFSENSRECSILETKHFGTIIQVEVGALMVGKIKNIPNIKTFKRGDEKGYFCFGGSTVIMLFKENTIKLDDDIVKNSKENIETKVKLGEHIGSKIRG